MSKYMSESNFNDLVEILKTKYMHLELAEKYILQYAYPVGTVYETTINGKDPSDFIGGTWVKATDSAGRKLTVNGKSKTVYAWERIE